LFLDLDIVAGAGYQFDYVFDWTILKYPQIGGSSRGRVSSCKFKIWNLSTQGVTDFCFCLCL